MTHSLVVDINMDTDHFIWLVVKLAINGNIEGNVYGYSIHKGESYHVIVTKLNAVLGASKSVLMMEHDYKYVPVTYTNEGKKSSYDGIIDYLVLKGYLK